MLGLAVIVTEMDMKYRQWKQRAGNGSGESDSIVFGTHKKCCHVARLRPVLPLEETTEEVSTVVDNCVAIVLRIVVRLQERTYS